MRYRLIRANQPMERCFGGGTSEISIET
jgi:hypothetical protein